MTWVIIFLLISLFSKENLRKRKFLILAIIGFFLFTNTFVFDRFMNAWEVPSVPENTLGEYDAAIVLTGMTSFDIKNDRVEFNDRTDRIMQALHLFRKNKVHNILLCGGPSSGNENAELIKLKDYLITEGIPEAHLFTEMLSKNTHQNAALSKPLLDKLFPNGKYLLITSGYHMRRAAGCFLKVGINIFPYSTDMYGGPAKFDLSYLFLPSAETLFNWEKLFHEWFGMIYYKLTGYV
jgi:uncharacterized SAM-binding protein YcdF (DUF218 family)